MFIFQQCRIYKEDCNSDCTWYVSHKLCTTVYFVLLVVAKLLFVSKQPLCDYCYMEHVLYLLATWSPFSLTVITSKLCTTCTDHKNLVETLGIKCCFTIVYFHDSSGWDVEIHHCVFSLPFMLLFSKRKAIP